MAPALRGSVSASSPFVYVDVGCKDAAEGVFVLETFPEGAQVGCSPRIPSTDPLGMQSCRVCLHVGIASTVRVCFGWVVLG